MKLWINVKELLLKSGHYGEGVACNCPITDNDS